MIDFDETIPPSDKVMDELTDKTIKAYLVHYNLKVENNMVFKQIEKDQWVALHDFGFNMTRLDLLCFLIGYDAGVKCDGD